MEDFAFEWIGVLTCFLSPSRSLERGVLLVARPDPGLWVSTLRLVIPYVKKRHYDTLNASWEMCCMKPGAARIPVMVSTQLATRDQVLHHE